MQDNFADVRVAAALSAPGKGGAARLKGVAQAVSALASLIRQALVGVQTSAFNTVMRARHV